jgi:hypothetical protein
VRKATLLVFNSIYNTPILAKSAIAPKLLYYLVKLYLKYVNN